MGKIQPKTNVARNTPEFPFKKLLVLLNFFNKVVQYSITLALYVANHPYSLRAFQWYQEHNTTWANMLWEISMGQIKQTNNLLKF
jgi:hypothetical protein